MDLISLEIHIHLKIKGEHTQGKTYLWFGCSWNTHTVNWATVQQTHGSRVALGLHKAGRGFSHKQSILQMLEDNGFLSQGCGTEAMRKCSLGGLCLFEPQGHNCSELRRGPYLTPQFSMQWPGAFTRILVSPNSGKHSSWCSLGFWEVLIPSLSLNLQLHTSEILKCFLISHF